MKSIQRHLVLAAITVSGVVGCQATAMNTASESEPVDDVSEELQETTCTTATTVTKKTLTGTAPTSCGTFQNFSAFTSAYTSNNPDTCPFQFLVEVARSTSTPIGSGYQFEGVPYVDGIVTGFQDKADCESQQASYAAWGFVGGAWTSVGTVWLKGTWNNDPDPDILFPCRWANYASPTGSLLNVPANATKIRVAASQWKETGTKGATGTDTYRQVTAGISAGVSCPI